MNLPQTHFLYEPFAETEEYRAVNGEIVARWLEVMREHGAKGVERLLDIATGVGTMVQLFLEHLPRSWSRPAVVCLDMSEQALEQTSGRLRAIVPCLELVHASAEHLDLPQHSVDVAVWGNGIHYLDPDGQERALRGIRRVVKPGGWFVFNTAFYAGSRPPDTVPFYRAQVRRAVEYLRIWGVPRQGREARPEASGFLPCAHYEELLQRLGFALVEVRETAARIYRNAWEHISGFQQYAAGALHGYDPEAAAAAMRKAVQPALEEHGARDESGTPYVLRHWLGFIARVA